jgi:putative chitinase
VTPHLNSAFARFDITNGLRVAGFLAQCSHESMGFRVTVENLSYGAQALLSLFPRYFDAGSAAAYAHQPERIASRIYANRMGNGNEATEDGWKFRGRGFIQITGRSSYTSFDDALQVGGAIVNGPDALVLPDLAALSAAWFWKTHGLNEIADAKDIVHMTKVINGGTLGLAERTKLYEQALRVFSP